MDRAHNEQEKKEEEALLEEEMEQVEDPVSDAQGSNLKVKGPAAVKSREKNVEDQLAKAGYVFARRGKHIIF